jgi:hypothetical protein
MDILFNLLNLWIIHGAESRKQKVRLEVMFINNSRAVQKKQYTLKIISYYQI